MKQSRDLLLSADKRCRQHYENLIGQFLDKGIDPKEIAKALTLYSMDRSTCWIDEAAYRPTGVALGCPLPDACFSKQLYQTAKTVANNLTSFLEPGLPIFAFVPPESYHVTLVNYSHFDCATAKEEIVPFDRRTFENILDYFQSHIYPKPHIQFKGLILTRAGRLLVPGYAINTTAFDIRSDLTHLVSQFSTNLPVTLHIKLGHLLRNLDGGRQRDCMDIIERRGRTIDRTLVFTAVHTSRGDIHECFS